VLAPEDDSRALDALRFSLASDIVELVVLTADDTFLQTLREAVGPSRRLWHVLSSDKVSDLLIAGGVGILVLDVQALHEAAARFIAEIKRQFPDLVVVVAGSRDAETELARLISDGSVYRFIHKPMSPARARLFADAAVKRYTGREAASARALGGCGLRGRMRPGPVALAGPARDPRLE
jgi:DNA-binding NtrC family response regulator